MTHPMLLTWTRLDSGAVDSCVGNDDTLHVLYVYLRDKGGFSFKLMDHKGVKIEEDGKRVWWYKEKPVNDDRKTT